MLAFDYPSLCYSLWDIAPQSLLPRKKKAGSRSPPPKPLDRRPNPSGHPPQRTNRRPRSRERNHTQTTARRHDRQTKPDQPTTSPMLKPHRTTQDPNATNRTTSQRPRTRNRRTRQNSHDKHQNAGLISINLRECRLCAITGGGRAKGANPLIAFTR